MSIIKYISMKEKGWVVEFYFRDIKFHEIDFRKNAIIYKNWEVLKGAVKSAKIETKIENEENVISIEIKKVEDFITVYNGFQYKYTKRMKTYTKGTKSWDHFAQAAVTAVKYELDFETYIRMISKNYSERNKSEKMVFPYPAQMRGDYAEEIIMGELAKSTKYVDPVLKGKKRALANQYISLDKDNYYIDIKIRLKNRTFTAEDISYLETRQIQVYGDVKEWVQEYKDMLTEKEKKNGGEPTTSQT